MTINATNITMRIGAGGILEHPVPIAGLLFPSNDESNSDIRIMWDGAAYLPRNTHTVIRKVKFIQQTGFYAFDWHSANTGSWDPAFSYGTHPYPCDGGFDTSGNVTGATSGTGTVHYYETAGSNADHISTSLAGLEGDNIQESLITTKNVWVTQARVCELINGGLTTKETFYPDLTNNPDFEITRTRTVASLGTPSAPAYYIGASDWTASGTTNEETPSCYARFFKLFDVALSYADILTEITSETNTPQSTAGIASVHYMNINPTITDITDKSGSGNSPSWDNANRPTNFTE